MRDVPHNTSAATLSKYLAPGKLLEFRANGTCAVGVVLSVEDPEPSGPVPRSSKDLPPPKYRVVSDSGEEVSILPSQIVAVMPGVDYGVNAAREFADAVRLLISFANPRFAILSYRGCDELLKN